MHELTELCYLDGMTTRRMTARQLAAALRPIDAQIAAAEVVVAAFSAAFEHVTVTEEIGNAWNAMHDAVYTLKVEREAVALNPYPISAADIGTWRLIQDNVD